MTLLHSCQKAAELISQSLDEPLDMVDKLRLRVHLSMCGNCRNVQEQLNLIHKMGSQIGTLDLCDDSGEAPFPQGN
ncbi:zf-HC2 domain-containing protein [Rhodoferax sp.]|uniref:zf-HC2 domain-containing protein n=1 Tax=Rhodoferax sp. TaxID=50421 RepID=UPI00260BDDC6|nr:zf-HC2 domain-containing protein [Rhodoferax sp.]MDD2919506.1 zf-HC2 domain-containing protein [Rhodoferax sp.]